MRRSPRRNPTFLSEVAEEESSCIASTAFCGAIDGPTSTASNSAQPRSRLYITTHGISRDSTTTETTSTTSSSKLRWSGRTEYLLFLHFVYICLLLFILGKAIKLVLRYIAPGMMKKLVKWHSF